MICGFYKPDRYITFIFTPDASALETRLPSFYLTQTYAIRFSCLLYIFSLFKSLKIKHGDIFRLSDVDVIYDSFRHLKLLQKLLNRRIFNCIQSNNWLLINLSSSGNKMCYLFLITGPRVQSCLDNHVREGKDAALYPRLDGPKRWSGAVKNRLPIFPEAG